MEHFLLHPYWFVSRRSCLIPSTQPPPPPGTILNSRMFCTGGQEELAGDHIIPLSLSFRMTALSKYTYTQKSTVEFFFLSSNTFALKKSVSSVMVLWVWVFFLSSQMCAFVTKASECTTETIHGNPFPSGPTHQELALITPVPRIEHVAIQKRADIATCAYISGNAGT